MRTWTMWFLKVLSDLSTMLILATCQLWLFILTLKLSSREWCYPVLFLLLLFWIFISSLVIYLPPSDSEVWTMLKDQPCSHLALLCGPLSSCVGFDGLFMDQSQIYASGSDIAKLQIHTSTCLRSLSHLDKCCHLKFNLFKTKLIPFLRSTSFPMPWFSVISLIGTILFLVS